MDRRTRGWLMVIVLVIIILGLRAQSKQILPEIAWFETPQPLVIAHRGGAGLRPENTLLAFRHAVRLGVDVLEFDVRASADGQLVVMHDETVDRTSNGQGSVSSLSYAELKTLDAAYHWQPAQAVEGSIPPYRGEGVHIPSVAEVLAEFDSIRLNIEIKQRDGAVAEQLCGLIRQHQAEQRVLVAAEGSGTIQAFRDACPNTPTATSYRESVGFLLNHFARLLGFYHPRAYALELPVQSHGVTVINTASIQAAQRQGMHMIAWTINERAQMQQLLEQGVDGIISDYPDRLLAAVRAGQPAK